MSRSSSHRSQRAAERAARRADRDGSGPTLEEREPARFPGAGAKFALFGEVLLVGLLMTLVSLPLVTLPAALVAGIRHLRRYVRAEGSPLSAFWGDVRDSVVGGLGIGLVSLVLSVILVLDIDLARSGFLPGGAVIEIVGWVGLGALAVALLTAARLWDAGHGWRGAVRGVPAAVGSDVPGAFYVLATAVFVGVVTWALVPLIVAGLGCAALAMVSIPERPRRGIR